MAITALNRKLLRDLAAMKSQAFAIALVVAAGVAMYVMYLSNFESLRRSQRAYYQAQRFADVFATLKRAPLRVGSSIEAIPGVTAVDLRVVADVTLDLEDLDAPAAGRFVSIPADRRPALNDLVLRRGRWIAPGRPDEVLASEAFAAAHRLVPGDSLHAVINGRRRRLTVVGIALSPEYIYIARPGQFVPDDERYGVFWMDYTALAAAFDMEGGFNNVVLALSPAASSKETVARLDQLLYPYGGLGAVPRALQLSHWMVEGELTQLQQFGLLLPLIFLTVAAFILNIALSRALALQRPQIATLKALGYGNRALGWHYMKFALIIGLVGVALGLVVGAWMGSAVGDLYNRYFRFPQLAFVVPWQVILGASVMTLGAAAAGAFSAVRRAVRMSPAEAMGPQAPQLYGRSIIERSFIARRLDMAGRMILRNLSRHPLRAAASVFGIALAVATLMIGMVFMHVMDRLIAVQFWVAERQEITVTFVEPRSAAAWRAVARLPGVLSAEPQRSVPARIRSLYRERYLVVTGVTPGSRLHEVIDSTARSVPIASSGITISQKLAEILDVTPGDRVSIEVLEGERPVRDVTIANVVDDVMGLAVYMEMDALHALMREGRVFTGALMLVDPQREGALLRELKRTPGVAGSSFKRAFLKTFRETMAANMNLTITVNVVFAAVIAFGVVYNAARVSLSERSHELASLRVLGYTRAEISLILMGELALLTLAALPFGWMFGYGLTAAIMRTVQSEVYRIPLWISPQAVAWASLGIVAAAFVSGLIVRRRLDRLDLIAVLKVRQ
ncbi:MAG TPA: FtsX-like permease family protein [Vicinamibacterales bacterium]|nr:FtsX-like permease family protein [Vicinamibacterales bacterium]